MLHTDGRIAFYLPHAGDAAELPARLEDYWPWICRNRRLGEGRYSWTLQSYLQLKEAGLPVDLVTRLPSRGVVISHRDFLPLFLRPRPGVFLVCIKPDRKEHPWAHYYVVQNPSDRIFAGRNRDRSAAVPLWPQPSLIPRRPDRGSRCDTAAYFGRPLNLAAALKSAAFAEELTRIGVTWRPQIEMDAWHDYGDIDVVVAVRTFDEEPSSDPKMDPDSKPPTKLMNAWLAGVPAIVGRESAFMHIRRGPLDAIEATSPDEVTAAIRTLRTTPSLYEAMVANAAVRSREFSADAVVGRWKAMLEGPMAAALGEWTRRGAIGRQVDNVGRSMAFFADRRNLVGISGAKRRATSRADAAQDRMRS